MSLVSLVLALLIEQARPLQYRQIVFGPLCRIADSLDHLFNAGKKQHGMIAWCVGVGGCVLVTGLIYFILSALSPVFALAFNVLVLYFTMGFRQFSHFYTDIHLALRMDDLPRARKLLAEWREKPAEHLTSFEVARLAIEEALVSSHRHVFGVLLWFVILPGPCGAVLYRVAAAFAEHWGGAGRRNVAAGVVQSGAIASENPATDVLHTDFGSFAQQLFAVLDWLSLRTTAAAFAVVGNFEDAIYCWRTQAGNWADDEIGIVLASGAGALGVRLGVPLMESGVRAELAMGEEADVDFMQSAVGLVWRAVVLWVVMLLLLGLAGLVGA